MINAKNLELFHKIYNMEENAVESKTPVKVHISDIQYVYPNAKYPESYSITLTIADKYNLVIEDDGTWWIYEEEGEEEEEE